jgi:potassium efflux system protein
MPGPGAVFAAWICGVDAIAYGGGSKGKLMNKRICREGDSRSVLAQTAVFRLVNKCVLPGWLLPGFTAAFLFCNAGAAAAAPGPAPATNNAPGGAAATNATAIPLAEIATQAESASANLQTIEADLSSDQTTRTVQQDLPVITPEINARLEENSKILARSPSLDRLRRLESEWQQLREQLSTWKRTLARRESQLDAQAAHLAQLDNTWELTLQSGKQSTMPAEVSDHITSIIADIKLTRSKAAGLQEQILTLQSRVTEQDARLAQALSSISHAREEAVTRLFIRDGPPIWSSELWSPTALTLVQESHHSFARQLRALAGYAKRKVRRFALQGLLCLAIFALLSWARRRRVWGASGEAEVKHAEVIFQVPFGSALLLSLLVSGWIYPQAPGLLWALTGAAALVPATIILRRVIDKRLWPVLNVLVAFYFIDQLRTVAASQQVLSHWLFLTEMLGAAIFAAWLSRSARLSALPDAQRTRWQKVTLIGVRLSFVFVSAAFLADAVGYASLGKFAGNAVLASAYLALMLYAVMNICEGVLASVLSAPALAQLESMKGHRTLIRQRAARLLEWLAILLWAMYVLEVLSLRTPLFQNLQEISTARLALGAFSFSFGDILLFVVIVWAAFPVSRFLRFILEVEVYPRVQLAPGLHYSISTMVHYAILVVGFLISVTLLGFDLTKLTILAGAVGVGLGFGLQNIINNFVSGLILLFERPVKIGDVIQIDSTEGVVQRIGIRASIVRAANGSEIIVPNGKLISDPVTNWTLSNRRRLVSIAVAIGPGPDAQRMLELLENTAAAHPSVIKELPPKALLTNFGGGSLNFEVRAWTNQSEDWARIRSDLLIAINAALAAQNIAIR